MERSSQRRTPQQKGKFFLTSGTTAGSSMDFNRERLPAASATIRRHPLQAVMSSIRLPRGRLTPLTFERADFVLHNQSFRAWLRGSL